MVVGAIELTVETDEFLVVRAQSQRAFVWCAVCADEVRMLKPETAAVLWGTSVREVYRRVEAGQVHFAEQPGGRLLVCVNSRV